MSRFVSIVSCEGGQNSANPPTRIGDTQVQAARNVDWYRATTARKRGGAIAISVTGAGFVTEIVASLIRHVPGTDDTAAELWAFFGTSAPLGIARYSGGAWGTPTGTGAFTGHASDINGASLNGKLFLAADQSSGRLMVWDPAITAYRLAGLGTPAAATVANTGAGAYAATARTYWVAYTRQVGGVTIRRSELSASVTFTPSGAGTAARVTRGAALNEGETHWELYASASTSLGGAVLIGTTVIATTTFDDSTAPASYTGAVPPIVGTNTPQKAYKYVLTDGNRLIGFGDWTSTGKANRLEYTPVLGTSDIGDDERVPQTATQKNYKDLDEKDSGYATGLAGPLYGCVYAFKNRQTWKLVPTGVDTDPYQKVCITKKIGNVRHQTAVVAEDADGNPALYWLSHRGPVRVVRRGGVDVLERKWAPIKDVWETVNLGASLAVAHGVYHEDKNQVWWWVATGSSNDPDTKIVYDVEKDAYSIHDGASAAARCSVMFSNTLGASVSRDLKPYIGRSPSTGIWKCDTSDTDDNGTAFQAYIKTKPFAVAGLGFNSQLLNLYVLAKAASGVTLTATIDRDFGAQTVTATADLTPEGSATRVSQIFDDAQLAGCTHIAVQVGDASASTAVWTMDELALELGQQEQV